MINLVWRRPWTAVLLTALLLAPAVSPVRAGAQPASPSAVTPAKVQAALPELDRIAQQTLEKTGVPGMAIAIVYQDQVVYLKGFGVREAGLPGAVDADTVFQLASMSKPIASTIVAGLAGDGIVAWDDPVVKHDPDFAMYVPWVTSQVTLRDMFAHRSGLPDHAGDLLEDIGYSRAEILHRLRYQPPDSSFRSAYAYTNFGLTAAGVAAARAAGKTWEEVAVERLFAPLGMTSTSPRLADFLAHQNRARGHVRENGAWVAKYQRDPDTESPAGGVSSSVRDLSQWVRLQLGGGMIDGRRLISAQALGATHVPQIVSNPPANPQVDRAGFYGLGWNVSYDSEGRVRLGHSGAFNLGAGTTVSLVPAEQIGIVVLTNAQPIGAAEAVALSFLDLAIEGRVTRDWLQVIGPVLEALNAPTYGTAVDYAKPPAQPLPALPADAYTGMYQNDFYGELEVAAADGDLVLRYGPQKTTFPMRHWDRDVFLYQPAGENAYGPSAVTFEVGPDQKAASVKIEYFNIHGQGTFARMPRALRAP
jgi:CubicO group peptidase (beta-lactamase class C family)